MARVTPIERSQIKAVIIESYKPDTTFRTNAEVKTRCHRQRIPIEMAILLVHSAVWKCKDKRAYTWLVRHYEQGVSYSQIAKDAGFKRATNDYILKCIDSLLDESVDRMSQKLADMCVEIYDLCLKGR